MTPKKAQPKRKQSKQTKKKIHTAIILDRSGSMESMWEAAKSHFREQVANLKGQSEKADITVSLTFFDNDIDVLGPRLTLDEAEKLDLEQYRPRHCTALYDAIGVTVGKLKEFGDEKDVSFLVAVITDGLENASTDYTHESIKKEIESLTKRKNWTFAFMAANIDAASVGAGLGISANNTMHFTGTLRGMKTCSSTFSSAVANFCSADAGNTDDLFAGNTDVRSKDENKQYDNDNQV